MRPKLVVPNVVAAVCGIAATADAGFIDVNWTGSDRFDVDSISFAAFESDELTAIIGDGKYDGALRSGGADLFIDIHLDGVWTPIWSEHIGFSDKGEFDVLVANSSAPTPITFSAGIVDGLRLRSTPGNIGSVRHFSGNWGSDDVFRFNEVNQVPEPSSLALLGMGGLSLFGYRLQRKRKTDLVA